MLGADLMDKFQRVVLDYRKDRMAIEVLRPETTAADGPRGA